MALSTKSTIRDLIANPEAKAILEKHLPGASRHPDLPQALYMSLREVMYYPEAASAGVTKEKLEAIDADLQGLATA
ncbi:MAG: hypothetical protein KJZ86_26920 [Caldilineaceae bacterium]|nr:hypothetical protein [Caldilineaceae bacterium]HRJ45051.1 hypothetical protein [Caldilineaceae bacterium]